VLTPVDQRYAAEDRRGRGDPAGRDPGVGEVVVAAAAQFRVDDRVDQGNADIRPGLAQGGVKIGQPERLAELDLLLAAAPSEDKRDVAQAASSPIVSSAEADANDASSHARR
jgi:hypothetical protein